MSQLLTPDELLTTTRAVRRRLDLTRPVEREVIEECLSIAQQGPTAGNRQHWHFMVVTEPGKRTALAELFRRGRDRYRTLPISSNKLKFDDPKRMATQARIASSSDYLADHLHDVPILVIPCIVGRTEGLPTVAQSAQWGSIAPAAWSFMLAARAHGLGTCWTSFHLFFEEDAAKILGIPYSDVMQACLIPVAYTKGSRFRPAPRNPLHTLVHWEKW